MLLTPNPYRLAAGVVVCLVAGMSVAWLSLQGAGDLLPPPLVALAIAWLLVGVEIAARMRARKTFR